MKLASQALMPSQLKLRIQHNNLSSIYAVVYIEYRARAQRVTSALLHNNNNNNNNKTFLFRDLPVYF